MKYTKGMKAPPLPAAARNADGTLNHEWFVAQGSQNRDEEGKILAILPGGDEMLSLSSGMSQPSIFAGAGMGMQPSTPGFAPTSAGGGGVTVNGMGWKDYLTTMGVYTGVELINRGLDATLGPTSEWSTNPTVAAGNTIVTGQTLPGQVNYSSSPVSALGLSSSTLIVLAVLAAGALLLIRRG